MSELKSKLVIDADTRRAVTALGALRQGVASIGDQLRGLRGGALQLLGAVGVVQSVRGIAQLSDAYAGLTARLRVATRGDAEFRASLAATRSLAQQYVQPLRETASLYTRVLAAVRPLGGGVREAGVATEALLASLRISGASAGEASSAILQFSQALGSGVLRGEEFNAIAEAAPPLLDALAEGLGKPRHELRALAEQGLLSSSAVVGALAQALPQLRAQAGEMGDTIGGAAQQVRDAFFELVGASAKGSEGVAVVVGAMKALAENIGTVVQALGWLAGAIVALKLGAFAQGLYAAGAAATAGATGVTAFGLALRGALAFITGPVGWIVALTSLAAAWLAVRAAASKAGEATLDALRTQRAAIQAELDALRKGGVALSADYKRRLELERERDRLDAQIEALQAKAAAAPPADPKTNLRDPGTLTRLGDEYKTAREISKKFEADRIALVAASEKEVAYLRAQGRTKEADDQAAATQERLALIDKAEQEALRKQTPVASRVAQYKAAFDATLDLQRDAIEREKALNQQRFDDGLSDLQTYLAERARLEDAGAARDIAKLERELAERRKVLAANEKRVSLAGDPNERETINEAVYAQRQEVAQLEAEIAKRTRDQADAGAARLRDARLLTAELERQQADIERQLAAAEGRDLTPAQMRAAAIEQLRPQFEALAKAGASEAPLLRLVDVAVTRGQLQQVQHDYERVRGAIATREADLAAGVAAGTLTRADAEAKLLALRAQQVPALDAIIERMRTLAQTDDERAAIDALAVQVKGLRDVRTELQKTAQSAATSAISTALDDIATGAKTAKDALLDMVGGFAKAMLNVLNQRLAEQLVNQFVSAAGSGGASGSGTFAAIGQWIASLFHTGGVVGGSGGVRRAVNPAAFAFAPRYHAGGIAGLSASEVPAILQRGEEVLTADDPRHAKNFQANAGGNVVNVSVSGAQGNAAQLNAGGADLGRVVLGVVEQWAAKQSRTGGLLAR